MAGLAILGLALAAGAVGFRAWKSRQIDVRIDAALEELRDDRFPDELTELVSNLARRGDRHAEQRLFEGAQALQAGDAPGAATILRTVRPEGRVRIPAFLLAGESNFRLGQMIDAETLFRRAADESPTTWKAHFRLGEIYVTLGSIPAAIDELRRVSELRPDDYRAYRLLGRIENQWLHRHEEAIALYRSALERGPPESDRAAIVAELAQCLVLTKDYEAGLEILKSIPETTATMNLTAECLWGTGKPAEAQKLLDEIAATDPDHQAVLMLGGVLAIERDEPRRAVELLERLLERNPHDFVARHQLSLAWLALGDRAASDAESARMKRSQDLHKRLEDVYTRAIHNPADATLRDELAEICDELGQTDAARRWRDSAAQTRQAIERHRVRE